MTIKEELARAVNHAGWTCDGGSDEPDQYDDCEDCKRVCDQFAAALMPLVRRAQAEALREAAGEIEATFADYDRRRPLHPKAEVATDYVNDSQWAELIVRNRADRIEQEVEQ